MLWLCSGGRDGRSCKLIAFSFWHTACDISLGPQRSAQRRRLNQGFARALHNEVRIAASCVLSGGKATEKRVVMDVLRERMRRLLSR
jgi:hypothetical protein